MKLQKSKKDPSCKRLRRKEEMPLHLMLLPGLIVVLIYNYGPMGGLIMAFENYKPTKGLWASAWVGLGNFNEKLRIRRGFQ